MEKGEKTRILKPKVKSITILKLIFPIYMTVKVNLFSSVAYGKMVNLLPGLQWTSCHVGREMLAGWGRADALEGQVELGWGVGCLVPSSPWCTIPVRPLRKCIGSAHTAEVFLHLLFQNLCLQLWWGVRRIDSWDVILGWLEACFWLLFLNSCLRLWE